jgi:hypothetical protein
MMRRLLPLLALVLPSVTAGSLRAQDPRDALVGRAFNEFDAQRRLQLLMGAVNPTAGPPRGAWPVGVQLLAQTLIEDKQDSLAGVWLRWAVRLSPDLQPDTVQFLPQVVTAYRSARAFVLRTRTAGDSAAPTTWLWPAQQTAERDGGIQIASSTVPLRVEIKGVGLVAPGGRVTLAPNSYEIAVSAAGRDSLRVTREVLPGVTTVVEFLPRSFIAQSTAAPTGQVAQTRPTPAAVPQKKKGFPMKAVLIGAAGVGLVAALAGGGGGGGGSGPEVAKPGGITITFPNP